MKKVQVVNRENKARVMEFLQREGQLLLPFLDWVETRRMALDELIDVTGRAMIEMLLRLSAEGLAGPKERGRPGGAIRWHGSQGGVVNLSDRKLRVTRPRLGRMGEGASLLVAPVDVEIGTVLVQVDGQALVPVGGVGVLEFRVAAEGQAAVVVPKSTLLSLQWLRRSY